MSEAFTAFCPPSGLFGEVCMLRWGGVMEKQKQPGVLLIMGHNRVVSWLLSCTCQVPSQGNHGVCEGDALRSLTLTGSNRAKEQSNRSSFDVKEEVTSNKLVCVHPQFFQSKCTCGPSRLGTEVTGPLNLGLVLFVLVLFFYFEGFSFNFQFRFYFAPLY